LKYQEYISRIRILYDNWTIVCPTWNWVVYWGLREMGSAWGRGARVGPAHQKGEKISSQFPTKAGNKVKDEKDHPSRT
jgi:hypothetical protein